MKKWLKIVLISFIIITALTVLSILGYIGYILSTQHTTLNLEKLENLNNKVSLYNNKNTLISANTQQGCPTINFEDINTNTINAFIAIEDQDFFKHNGLNYKRIIKALLTNITSGYAKEGASTITQQLIKNTQLSNEKTFNRKIKEAALALDLEKKYNKKQILQAYLNIIYFGNNSYGIEQASQNYFGHSAKNLSLAESATLAGMIKSPLLYSPITNMQNCLKRRNLVLKQMLDCKFITEEDYNLAIDTPIIINNKNLNNNYAFEQMVIKEAQQKLHLTQNALYTSGLCIYTTLNNEVQNYLQQSITPLEKENQYSTGIVLDNTGAVLGFYSTLPDIDAPHCPASLIKPILCYASAFEYNILTPASPILDEPISFNGYTPQNIGNKYAGWTDVRKSLAHSLNIPAIKALEYVGIEKAKDFASNFKINFTQNDNHLALALGSLENGVTLCDITSAYNVFANLGKNVDTHFINKITTTDGTVLYSFKNSNKTVCKDSTAFLINDILSDSAKFGTAKKLKNLDIPICSKTGTNGYKDGTNIDAWNISYNNKFCAGFWYGNISGNNQYNLNKNQNGGTIATNSAYKLWKNLKKDYTFNAFLPPQSVTKINIDLKELQNTHTIVLANDQQEDRYITSDYYPTSSLSKLKTVALKQDNQLNIQPRYTIDNKKEQSKQSLYKKLSQIWLNKKEQ